MTPTEPAAARGHTPGKWITVDDVRGSLCTVRRDRGDGNTGHAIATVEWIDDGSVYANARLIAAAPELLAFVERVSTLLDSVATLDCPDDCEGKPDAPCAYCLAVNRSAEFESEARQFLAAVRGQP